MFKNHIKIAWRSLKRQPFFTFLNTFGLAIGMAGGLLISLYIYDEMNFDTMFKDADRIYRINTDTKFGGTESKSAEVSAPMAAAMENDFSQVELTTRFRNLGSMLLRKSDAEASVKEQGSTFVDATFFEMFGLDLLEGDVKTALKEPNTLVLTRSAALKHFGLKDALGQQLLLNNTDTYTVTGVIEDMPERSFLRNHNVFMAMAGSEEAKNQEWTSHNFFTFIKLIPGADIADFQEPLQSMLGTYIMPYVQTFLPGATEEQLVASGNYLYYSTIALKDIHLYSNKDHELSSNSSIQNVYILSFIGLFLILLASVNFMNLSTAQSLKRAKEVGIRKTLGSDKSALIRQFLTESGLISFISLLFALVIAIMATPYFNALSGKSISIPFTDPFFWMALFIGSTVLALFSGMYPAFFMSRFVPVKVLKGAGTTSTGGGNIRSFLVVFQFAISVFLIVSTLVVFMQLKFIQNKDLGFTKDQVLIVDDVYTLGDKATAFKEEVEQLGRVESATLSSFLPTPSSRSNTSFFKEGGATAENSINMQIWNVDDNYIPTLNMEILEGRNFDRQFGTDSTVMLINESAVAILGVQPKDALGMRIIRNFEDGTSNYFTIIGVIKNFNYESLREDIGALSMTLGRSTGSMAIKLEAGDFSNSIASVGGVWNKIAPGQPFAYRFMEDSFNTTYEAEQQLGRIFVTFTILSILIACLGLFGLAAFNAQKRTKEIGIRKVLGASVGQISYRLTTDFLKMVGVAILISLPVGWYLMNKWLEDFTYRIEIEWWVFALAAFLAIGIAILTVSYQSIKAAIVNPVKSLRTE
ncbi:ABC transporter permease [Arenibacter echinorum]|uniref:Putative ABC transport system permease protein n=1 Tax=Arenibacter echinorum TaxID=440515 RepID=A0A327QXD7_9FLAO|nr:ABC transporter permease [Arenibacter echinorum]RAJ08063.1 putative ABC transport system permease protein [Arenibacter echinorum]